MLGSGHSARREEGVIHLHGGRQEASLAPWCNYDNDDDKLNDDHDDEYDNDDGAAHDDHSATKLRQPLEYPSKRQ